jgi:putative transposase
MLRVFLINTFLTKEFVSTTYQRFKAIYPGVREKRPKAISGLEGIYSLKRLSEAI